MKRIPILMYGLLLAWQLGAQRLATIPEGLWLCGQQPIKVAQMSAQSGDNYLAQSECAQDFPERHAQWLQWQCAKAGSVAFVLHPLDVTDDLDFALLRQENDGSWQVIRCVAAGQSTEADSRACLGATGLIDIAADEGESSGCQDSKDNFASSVQASAGQRFALIVNNYRSVRGFWLEYIGSALPSAIEADKQGSKARQLPYNQAIFTTAARVVLDVRNVNTARQRERLVDYTQTLQPAFLSLNGKAAGCFVSYFSTTAFPAGA